MKQRLIFFDLEPGGIDPKRHPIIQIAAVAVDEQGDVLEGFEAKLQFNKASANKHSLRKNHYHPGIWAREARPEPEVARDFAAFLRRHATSQQISAAGKPFQVAQLVAHNVAFDGPFLTTWFEKLGVYLPAKRLILCTLQLALWQCRFRSAELPPNYQLATLCRFFGVPFHAASAHDALGDVSATVQLYRALTRSGSPGWTVAA